MLTGRQKRRNADMLATLAPDVRELAKMHLSRCAEGGVDLLVVQAARGMEEQASLYAQGRTMPGSVVTNARPGYSWHNFGRAYDVAVVEAGKPVWDSPGYDKAGEVGGALGLVWGGGFRKVKGDLGHFEYHPGLTLAMARRFFSKKKEGA